MSVTPLQVTNYWLNRVTTNVRDVTHHANYLSDITDRLARPRCVERRIWGWRRGRTLGRRRLVSPCTSCCTSTASPSGNVIGGRRRRNYCAAGRTDCPPGPMSALGGIGRAGPKEEVRVSLRVLPWRCYPRGKSRSDPTRA